MKKIVLLMVIALIMYGCGIPAKKVSDQQVLEKLEHLMEVEDFFNLKSTYHRNIDKLSDKHALYYSAKINNVFNNAEQSNILIEKLLAYKERSLNGTMLNKIYHTKLLGSVA